MDDIEEFLKGKPQKKDDIGEFLSSGPATATEKPPEAAPTPAGPPGLQGPPPTLKTSVGDFRVPAAPPWMTEGGPLVNKEDVASNPHQPGSAYSAKVWARMEADAGQPLPSVSRETFNRYDTALQSEHPGSVFDAAPVLAPMGGLASLATVGIASAVEGKETVPGSMAEYLMSKTDRYPVAAGIVGSGIDAILNIGTVPGAAAAKSIGAELPAGMKALREGRALGNTQEALAARTAIMSDVHVPTTEGAGRIVRLTPAGDATVVVGGKTVETTLDAIKRAHLADSGEVGSAIIAATRGVLGAPRSVLNAVDHVVGDNAIAPALKKTIESLPQGAQDALNALARSNPEGAAAEVANLVADTKTRINAGRAMAAGEGKQLSVALAKEGIPLESPEAVAGYQYLGGETGGRFPEELPKATEPLFNELRQNNIDQLKRSNELGLASTANVVEHEHGLMSAYYDTVAENYGLGRNPRNANTLKDIHARTTDSWGGFVDAPMDEVKAVIQQVHPGLDVSQLPYIGEKDGETLVKFGRGEDAQAVRNEVKKAFGDRWKKDTAALTIEQRQAMSEDMNPVTAYVRTHTALRVQNEVGQLLKSVGEKYAEDLPMVQATDKGGVPFMKAGAVPEGKVAIPDELRWGALRGKMVPQEVFDQLNPMVRKADDFADGVSALLTDIKKAYIANPSTALLVTTSHAAYGLAGGVSILDPLHWGKFWDSLQGMRKFRKTGVMEPWVKMASENGVINLSGLTDEFLNEAETGLTRMRNEGTTNANRWRLGAQILAGSPFTEVRGLGELGNTAVRAGVGAAHGAAYGALLGGPVGATIGAGAGAVGLPVLNLLARAGRSAFDIGANLYTGALFLKNLEEFGGDAVRAAAETKKFAWSYDPQNYPYWANWLRGSAAGQSGGARVFAKGVGPIFMDVPMNFARIGGNIVKEKPVSGMVMLGLPMIASAASKAHALNSGIISKKTADELGMTDIVLPMGKTGATVLPAGRWWPSADMIHEIISPSRALGIGVQAPIRAAFAAARDSKEPEILGGYSQRDRGESKAAAVLRVVADTLGGPNAALGRNAQTVRKAATGTKDYTGLPTTWQDAILKILIGHGIGPIKSPRSR